MEILRDKLKRKRRGYQGPRREFLDAQSCGAEEIKLALRSERIEHHPT